MKDLYNYFDVLTLCWTKFCFSQTILLFKDKIIKENELSLSAFQFNYDENKESLRAVCKK